MWRKTVLLEPFEVDHATAVGNAREDANVQAGRGDTAAYRASRQAGLLPFGSRENHIRGALAECAVAKHLGLYWHASVFPVAQASRYADLPDVGNRVEVKSVTRLTSTEVRLDAKNAGKGRVLWVAHPHLDDPATVSLFGWAMFDGAWNHPDTTVKYGGAARYFPTRHLRPYDPAVEAA